MSRSFVRTLVLGLGAGALLTSIASSARADDDRWRHERHEEWREHRDWHEREWHDWCRYHPGAFAYPGYYCPSAVVIAPPPAVVVAPPPAPVVVAPAPAVEVVVPLRIR